MIERKKFKNLFTLPYLNGENSNSVFSSVADARGVTHAEEAGEARTEAAMGPKKSPRLGVVVDDVSGAAPPRFLSSSSSPVEAAAAPAREEAAAPIPLAA